MRRICSVFLFLSILFAGCSENNVLDSGVILRENILKSNGCSFEALVVADYSDVVFEFGMRCRSDSTGKVFFEVISPESISGITGYIDSVNGNLTFDDKILGFSPIADGYLTPVSVPWIMVKGIMGGYLSSCAVTEYHKTLYIDDSYLSETFELLVTLNEENIPIFCEVIWKERRILSMKVDNFTFL